MADSQLFLPAHEQLARLRSGAVTSESLLRAALARWREINPRFNAVVALDEAGALEQARASDRAGAGPRPGAPLAGLPMTVKDCFEVAGFATVNGAPEQRDYRPSRHAPAVQRLVDAGAVIFGKTNVPLYSLDLQTFNDVFGLTRNPWDPGCTPGGSGGGAAVALATGITALEISSDLAGSVRIPAHATGVCALKPSFGVVPTRGALLAQPGQKRAADLMVVGPMARCVQDLHLALDVLAGALPSDAAAWTLGLPPPRRPARSLRVAVWLDDANCPVAEPVATVLESACDRLAAAGATLHRAARPGFDARAYFADFFRLVYAEMSAGFPDKVFRAFTAAARAGVGVDWTPLSLMPQAVTQSHRQWLGVRERGEDYRDAWREFFCAFDVLLAPVAPTTAPAHDPRPFEQRSVMLGGRPQAYMQQAFWCALATLGHLPAAVVPAGLASDGLPVGLQIIGPYLGERTVLEFAAFAERCLGGFQPPRLRSQAADDDTAKPQ